MQVLDIEQGCVSDEDIGAEVDTLCEMLVVECCDDCAEEFLAGVDAGSDGAAAILTSCGNNSYNDIVHYKKVDLPRVGRSAPFGSGAGGVRAIMPHVASGAVAAYSSPGRNSLRSHSRIQGPFCAVQAGAVIKVATTLH